jgi:hypothetical protein
MLDLLTQITDILNVSESNLAELTYKVSLYLD